MEVQSQSRVAPTSEISVFFSEKQIGSLSSDISSSSGVAHARVTHEPCSHPHHGRDPRDLRCQTFSI